MGSHPANLALRFALEVGALAALVVWGATTFAGAWGWVIGLAAAVVAATAWGTFRVPGDASASGKAPVAVPGWVRLLGELVLFGVATAGLLAAGRPGWGWVFGGLVVVHYVLSWDRIAWLVAQR